MDLLARREHSRLELRTKLQNRFRKRLKTSHFHSTSDSISDSISKAVIESRIEAIQVQIDRLTDEGLQSDYRLAGSVIRSRSSRGHGPVKIGGELRQKGVNDVVISDAFREENIDWFEKIREVSHRKFGHDLPANSAERAKRGRFLQQRGFSWDQIQSI
jgi:regulatory protein